jgi:CBS domain-containing protein
MLLNALIENSLDTTCPVFADDALVAEVLALMQKGGHECAPVLHAGKISAMVTILDLLCLEQFKKTDNMRLSELTLEQSASIGLHEHLFDIFSRIRIFSSHLIPVSREDGTYAGVVEKDILLAHISALFHLGEEGITLELEVPSFDLKLSEVIAALEKNDATVLSFGIYPATPEGEGLVIAFRLQTHDLFRLVKNLEKYGYLIRYTSPFFKEKDDEMREKALEFIRFLDM